MAGQWTAGRGGRPCVGRMASRLGFGAWQGSAGNLLLSKLDAGGKGNWGGTTVAGSPRRRQHGVVLATVGS